MVVNTTLRVSILCDTLLYCDLATTLNEASAGTVHAVASLF